MALPEHGRPAAEVLAELESFKADDKDFRRGRTFGLVYHADDEDLERAVAAAHGSYLWHNALNPFAMPSLLRMEREVVTITTSLLGGDSIDESPAGFMTSGGTESLLLAVKAAKVRSGREHPNMVLATSAHVAFEKAADYFGVESRRIPVGPDWRADVDAMANAVDDSTMLVVGSAPQYPQGVIDPIPELAAIALDRGISFHTDACLGGFVLPFLDVSPWDFRVPGVTSISADIHKYGYVPKGASVLVHRTKELRNDRVFISDRWLGGLYASPGIPGARPGGPIAAAWAALQLLGREGLARLARAAVDARARLCDAMTAEGLTVLGAPEAMSAAFVSSSLDVFALGDELARRGWHLDRQSPPDSLHASCAPVHLRVMDEFVADLKAAVTAVASGATTTDRSTSYSSAE